MLKPASDVSRRPQRGPDSPHIPGPQTAGPPETTRSNSGMIGAGSPCAGQTTSGSDWGWNGVTHARMETALAWPMYQRAVMERFS